MSSATVASGTYKYDGTDMGEGNLGFPKRITSFTSEEGRAWFARGWLHVVNFNHEAAVDCFKGCITVEPEGAMGWWGIGELKAGCDLLLSCDFIMNY